MRGYTEFGLVFRSKMATAGQLQDDFLTCSICMEVFVQPVTLDCQHTFCDNCLGKYLHTRKEAVTNKSIPCPTCRQETPVPHPDRPVEEWAGQLKPGLLVTGLMVTVGQGSHQCSVCDQKGKTTPATYWCSDCEASYCKSCLQMHNDIPILQKHEVVPVTDKKSRQKKFICKEHDEKMKLYCKECIKPPCTVCCSIVHRTCKEVIIIKKKLTEVKSGLQEYQQNLAEKIVLTNDELENIDMHRKNMLGDRSLLELEVRKTIKEASNALKQKEDQLIKKVKDQTEQDKEQLRSMMKTKQMDLQLFKQYSQSIQQALELEDKAQLFEMYLSSGSGDGADVTRVKKKHKIISQCFIPNLENLKKEIRMMDVAFQHIYLDLTAAPVLDQAMNAKLDVRNICNVKDGLVLKVAGTEVTLISDSYFQCLKSFYTKNGQPGSSVLKVIDSPRCLTVVSEGKVAVSFPGSQHIITVAVTPDLELLSTIKTSNKYWGLSTLDQSTLVAGSHNPPSVDLIDMKGTILKTFTTLPAIGQSFINPHYIHVTRQGTILVSDNGLKSVICLTRSGDIVFTYTPTGDRALRDPRGITSISTGDIFVADCDTHKVTHLSHTGEFLRDILTAKDGLQFPTGVCFDRDKLCVTLYNKGLYKYRFG